MLVTSQDISSLYSYHDVMSLGVIELYYPVYTLIS